MVSASPKGGKVGMVDQKIVAVFGRFEVNVDIAVRIGVRGIDVVSSY